MSSYDGLADAMQWSCALLSSLRIDPGTVTEYSLHHRYDGSIVLHVTHQVIRPGTVEVEDREYEIRAVPVEPRGGSATFGPAVVGSPPRGRGSTSESTP